MNPRVFLRYTRIAFLYLMSLFISIKSSGQDTSNVMHFDHLTIKDGLSHNNVHCLLQDKNGYIWIGTQQGLNRYDGHEFKVFDSGDTESEDYGFVGNTVTSLFEDNEGNLWVGTSNNGINIKKSKSDQFYNLGIDTLFNDLNGQKISKIYQDRKGIIWIATVGNGLLKYNLTSRIVKHYTVDNSGLSSNIVFDIIEDNDGLVWVATSGYGLNYLEEGRDHFDFFNPQLEGHPNMNGFHKTMIFRDDNLWLATEGTGLYKVNLKNKSVQHYSDTDEQSISYNSVLDIHFALGNKLFIATNGYGLNVLDLSDGQMNYHDHQSNDKQALNSNSLNCLIEDRSGNLWIGTYNGGLNIYKPNKTWFDLIFPRQVLGAQLKNRSILSLTEDQKGGLYIGTDGGGLHYLHPDRKSKNHKSFTADLTNENSLSGNVVKTMYQVDETEIWLGIFDENATIYNPATETFTDFPSAKSVWTIDGNSDGSQICLGSIGQGLMLYDRYSKEINYLDYNLDDEEETDLVMCVLYDSYDKLWIGTAISGLAKYDEASGMFTYFQHSPSDSTSLSSNAVSAIFEDSHGELWVGTEDKGLNRYLGDGEFEHIGKKNGLIANSVMGITEDHDGKIWVTTFKGISIYDPRTMSIQNFDFRTDQNLNQFNQMAILSSGKKQLYFGGTNGLHTISPEAVKKPTDEVEFIFTDLEVSNERIVVGQEVGGQIVLSEPLETAKTIELSHKNNSFSLAFTAIDFTNLQEQYYEYRLEGFEDEWQHTKANQRRVSYTNLDPGNYDFKVRYRGSESSITVNIESPFWNTLWFRLLMILLISICTIGGFSFVIKRRDNNYKQKMLQLEKDNLETSVEAKNSQLMFFAVQMAHKNEILTNIKNELKVLPGNVRKEVSKLINSINRELKNQNYWDDFNLYFNQVDQDFVTSIQKEFPALTNNDIRLCSLMRMNLSNKEIATLCNISTRGVEQSKYRLKKRIGLGRDEDLSRFISIYRSKSQS